MSVPVGDVVERLRAYQVERRLTDEAMASELGVAQSTWTRVRRGEMGLGPRVLPAVLRLLGLELVEVERGRPGQP
jgi:transcriptional regulator with XRE-family HTH domain